MYRGEPKNFCSFLNSKLQCLFFGMYEVAPVLKIEITAVGDPPR
jgi:hypothetical protein